MTKEKTEARIQPLQDSDKRRKLFSFFFFQFLPAGPFKVLETMFAKRGFPPCFLLYSQNVGMQMKIITLS